MKISKIDIILFTKEKLPRVLYIIAAIMISIPLIAIAIGYDGFSDFIVNILLRGCLICIGTGKLIKALEKDKKDVTRNLSIGYALGIYTSALMINL